MRAALVFLLGTALLNGCGVGGQVAARAGRHALTAEDLAAILSGWRLSPARGDVGRQVAEWWVEYQLFAQRTVAGDSMLDSATVVNVMWPAARGYVLAAFRRRLLEGKLPLDSEAVDSAYGTGEHRLIQHILIRADSTMAPQARARQRGRADALRARLAHGLAWATANQENEDRVARTRVGSIGVIRRGETAANVEEVAFALQPGETSPVVESAFGFHIVRRPRLREVRGEFRAELERLLPEHVDSLYRRDLRQRSGLRLEPDGVARATEAVRDPLRFQASQVAIATFDQGRFTVADVVRWLRAMPVLMHSELERGSPQQLEWFLQDMMGYELMYREALRQGVALSADAFTLVRNELAKRLDRVRATLGVYPPAPGDSATTREMEQRAAEHIHRYLAALDSRWDQFERVPAGLVELLKKKSRWAVNPEAATRAVRRALELRAADTLRAP